MYVVVCDGETWIELPITAPRPLIESEVALATDQDSVTLPPPAKGEIAAGDAVNEEIVGTVVLLPANGTASVCRGTSRGVDGEVAVKLTLGAAPVTVIATVPTVRPSAFKSVAL